MRWAWLVGGLFTANFAREAVAHVSALSAGRSNAVAFGLSIIIGASVIFFIGTSGDDGRSMHAKRSAGSQDSQIGCQMLGAGRNGA